MTVDFRNLYGATETNGAEPGEQQAWLDELTAGGNQTLYWGDPQLAQITRLRLLTDPGFPMYDVSYCYGRSKDGALVRVDLPFHQLRKRTWKSDIVAAAKRDRVYAKGLNIFDPLVVSICC